MLFVFVVEGQQLARFLVHTQVNVGEQRSFSCEGKLLSHLPDGSVDLLNSLFVRFHIAFEVLYFRGQKYKKVS